MKPIEETHPSLKGKVERYSVSSFSDGTLSCEGVCYIEDVQKHTIDKSVLKERLCNFFNKLMTVRGKQSPDYSWEAIEDELLKELELEEE